MIRHFSPQAIKHTWTWSAILMAALALSCTSSDFSGTAGKGKKDARKDDSPKKDDTGSGDEEETDQDNGNTPDDEPGSGSGDGSAEAGSGTIEDFLSGSDKISTDEDGQNLQRFTPEEVSAIVDVLFVIDTSGSMDDEINQVETNLGNFLGKLAADARTKEFQLFILAGENDLKFTAPAAALSNPKFDFEGSSASHEVASHNALAVAKAFLAGALKTPKLSARKEAIKHVVFVTDDDANSDDDGKPEYIPESDFRSYLQASHADDEIHIHGIVCQQDKGDCADRGEAYINLAGDAKYKGLIQELTTPDWSPLLTELASAIQDSIGHTYKVSGAISDPAKVVVYINKTEVDPAKYEIDGQTITFEDGLIKAGDDIVVVY